MNERERLLRRIQAEDFAVYETVLYLDGHPKTKRHLPITRSTVTPRQHCERNMSRNTAHSRFTEITMPATGTG